MIYFFVNLKKLSKMNEMNVKHWIFGCLLADEWKSGRLVSYVCAEMRQFLCDSGEEYVIPSSDKSIKQIEEWEEWEVWEVCKT